MNVWVAWKVGCANDVCHDDADIIGVFGTADLARLAVDRQIALLPAGDRRDYSSWSEYGDGRYRCWYREWTGIGAAVLSDFSVDLYPVQIQEDPALD